MYIVMEGHDGTGKSTQVRMLSETLRKRGLEVVAAKEPGGTLVAERVRKMTKDKELDLDKYVSQLLLTAARVDLWLRVIQPALDRRAIVISDRSWFSALAYACAQGMSENEVLKITVDLMPERLVHPDLAFVFCAFW